MGLAENLTDETRAELDTIEQRTPDLERQIRAATSAVETEEAEQRAAAPGDLAAGEDGEDRERAELRGKVKFGEYIAAAIEQRSAAGPELEFNASMGIAGNRFPLELLAPPPERRTAEEHRAVTGVDSAVMPRRWLDRLFSGAASQALGITMESRSGQVWRLIPVTTAGASAAQRAKDQAAGDTAWTVGVTEMKPKRNAATLKFSIEDTARIPGLESALTRDLRMALGRRNRPGDIPGRCRGNRGGRGHYRTSNRRQRGGKDHHPNQQGQGPERP